MFTSTLKKRDRELYSSTIPTPTMANIFESDAPQHGHRMTESAHRKIELQSPDDLTYLIANVSRAAREKLDKHLPPDAALEGEDAMRIRVEKLIDEVSGPRSPGVGENC